MIYDEEFNDNEAKNYLDAEQNNITNIINIGKHKENEDMIIVIGNPLDMIDTFQGLAKLFCILSKITKKDTDTLIELLKKSISLEKEFDKKHRAEERIIKDAYKNN